MEKTEVLDCGKCKADTCHRRIQVVTFITKFRELAVITYQCIKCGGIKNVTHEKENKDYQVWD